MDPPDQYPTLPYFKFKSRSNFFHKHIRYYVCSTWSSNERIICIFSAGEIFRGYKVYKIVISHLIESRVCILAWSETCFLFKWSRGPSSWSPALDSPCLSGLTASPLSDPPFLVSWPLAQGRAHWLHPSYQGLELWWIFVYDREKLNIWMETKSFWKCHRFSAIL